MTKKEFDLFVQRTIELDLNKRLDYDIKFQQGVGDLVVVGDILLDGLENIHISGDDTCEDLLAEIAEILWDGE